MINCADELSSLLRSEADDIEITQRLYQYYLNDAMGDEIGSVRDHLKDDDLWIARFKFHDVFGDTMLFLQFGNDCMCRLLTTQYRIPELRACFEISRKKEISEFEISHVYNEDYNDEVVEQFHYLYGRKYETVDDVVDDIHRRKHISIPELELKYGVRLHG